MFKSFDVVIRVIGIDCMIYWDRRDFLFQEDLENISFQSEHTTQTHNVQYII